MKYRNLYKQSCYNCVFSSKLYAETSTKLGTYQFTEVKEYCYCTSRDKAKPYTTKCQRYLNSYNNLDEKLKIEDPVEDNLPF